MVHIYLNAFYDLSYLTDNIKLSLVVIDNQFSISILLCGQLRIVSKLFVIVFYQHDSTYSVAGSAVYMPFQIQTWERSGYATGSNTQVPGSRLDAKFGFDTCKNYTSLLIYRFYNDFKYNLQHGYRLKTFLLNSFEKKN